MPLQPYIQLTCTLSGRHEAGVTLTKHLQLATEDLKENISEEAFTGGIKFEELC